MNHQMFTAALAVAVLGAVPAHAVVVENVAVTAGEFTVFEASVDTLSIDGKFDGSASAAFTLSRGRSDGDTLSLDLFLENLDFLGQGIRRVTLTLEGVTFAALGDVEAAFSTPFGIESDDQSYSVGLLGTGTSGEYVSVGLGLNDPFEIDVSGLGAFETFILRINAVPAPATLALFGLGLAGLVAARRRA